MRQPGETTSDYTPDYRQGARHGSIAGGAVGLVVGGAFLGFLAGSEPRIERYEPILEKIVVFHGDLNGDEIPDIHVRTLVNGTFTTSDIHYDELNNEGNVVYPTAKPDFNPFLIIPTSF